MRNSERPEEKVFTHVPERHRLSYLPVLILVLTLSSATAARETNQRADGGGIDAFTGLLGSGSWIASGRSVTSDAIGDLYAGPSSINRAVGTSVGTTYGQPYKRIDGFDVGSIDVVTDRTPFGNLGFSYSRLQIDGLREATSVGALTGRSFDASFDAARLAFAPRPIGRFEHFGFGASLNYYGISIHDRSKSSFGLDLGADYTIDAARVMLNLRNISGDRNDPDRLPLIGEIRGEWSPYAQMHLGAAGIFREDAVGEYNVGIQYDIYKMISLLGGYQSGPKEWSAGAIGRYQNINVQYGIAAHRELDFSHTVSLGVAF